MVLQRNGVNQLPDAGGVADTDLFVLSREGRWRKLSATDLAGYLGDIGGGGGGEGSFAEYRSAIGERHLFDFVDNAVIPHASILSGEYTGDLADQLEAALASIPDNGGCLMLPPCTIRVSRKISWGNGSNSTISSRNGLMIRCDSLTGTDEGTFGGIGSPYTTRILYTGDADPTGYFLTLNGPMRGVWIDGIVLDCNGLMGYPWDLLHLMHSHIDLRGTKYTTGQGRCRSVSAPLPYGVTIGMFHNVLKLRTTLPWQDGALKRGTAPHQYMGNPDNNIGFSLNYIECEHVFDNAGTAAMEMRYIDNNTINLYSRTSNGTPPQIDPTNAGVGIRKIVSPLGSPIGENMFTVRGGGGAVVVYESGATRANTSDEILFTGTNDYGSVPADRSFKTLTFHGVMANGWTGSLELLPAKCALTTAASEFIFPVGLAAPQVNRFEADVCLGRTALVTHFSVNLGIAPGTGATRSFQLHINGVDIGPVISFGATETGIKRGIFGTPPGLLTNATICIHATRTGTPAISGVQTSIGIEPNEAFGAADSGVTPLLISGAPSAVTVGGSTPFIPVIVGGAAPYTLSLFSGTLPAGRTISGNSVVGTYTTAASYSYVLRATDALAATADLPLTETVASVITVPAAPSVVVGPGDTQNSVAWTDGSNGGATITAHKVYGSTTSGFTPGGGNLLYSGASASPYIHTGLTNGTTWYYKVVATNSVGDSSASTQQSGTPTSSATVPGAPTLAVTPGAAQNSITFTDGTTGGSAITARKLYRSTTPGFTPGVGNLIATSPTFPYVDSGLTNGTTYYYKGIATNAIGDSAASTQQSGTPVAPALTLAQKGLPSMFYNGALPTNLVESTPGVFSSSYSDATFINSGTMYYVAPTGNDTTGDGSSGTPWRTWQKFLDTAPTNSVCTAPSGGRYGPTSVPAGKSMTIIGPSDQSAIAGDLISEVDISAWGAYGSGRQTVTLTTGAVSGFVDFTQFRYVDEQGRSVPQVSCVATTAAGIATWQANKDFDAAGAPTTDDPVAGVFRSTPSQVGAAVPRDLAGKADTEIAMWRRTSAPACVIGAGSQLFAKNITFIGGATETLCPQTGRLVSTNCRYLGAEAQNLGLNGTSVLHQCVVRGCSNSSQDLVDYSSTGGIATMVEIDCLMDQCSPGGADDCSTLHGGRGMRINGRYLHASHPIDDANAPIIIGVFGTKLRAANVSATFAIGLEGEGELHAAGITFLTGPFKAFNFTKSSSQLKMMKVYDYDGCFTGKTAATTSNLTPTLRTAAKSTADTVFVDIDLSIANLRQDTAGTTAVTSVGDPVQRINLASGEFLTAVAGTYTYQLDGTKPVLRGGTANAQAFAFNLTDTIMDESTNVVLGVKSSDTGGILAQLTLTSTAGDYRSSGQLTGAVGTGAASLGFHPGTPTYTVDGSATTLTTATQMKTAAFNNAPHVISIINANLSYVGWMRMQSFMVQFDGDFYGGQIVRATDSTNLRAHQTVIANRTGATLV